MTEEKKPEEGFMDFVLRNKWDAVAYAILFVGLIISVFDHLIGGGIVGIILGLYFSSGVKGALSQFKEYLTKEGIFKGFVLLAGAIALFIASPGLVLGTLLGAFVYPYIAGVKG